MQDINGVDIRVGDRIVYAASAYGHSVRLRKGVVTRLTPRDPEARVFHDTLGVQPEGDRQRAVSINLAGNFNESKVMVL